MVSVDRIMLLFIDANTKSKQSIAELKEGGVEPGKLSSKIIFVPSVQFVVCLPSLIVLVQNRACFCFS